MDKEKIATFAERLSEALQIKGVRQADLSFVTKIPKSAISQYISGAFEPKQDRIHLIAQVLDVSEMWLCGYNVPMEKKNIKRIVSKSIGKNVQTLRENLNMSLQKFAEKLNIEESVVLDIENGKHIVDKELLFRICDVLYVTPDFLNGTIVELLESGDLDAEYRYTRQQNTLITQNLTEREQQLLKLFRRVPEDKKQMVIDIIEVTLGKGKA